MSNYDEAYAVALDATFAMKLAYLFSDNLGDALAERLTDEVDGQTRADDDEIADALEAAERDIDRMTPEDIGALVVKRLTERRAVVAAQKARLLERYNLDFGSMARAIVGAGK